MRQSALYEGTVSHHRTGAGGRGFVHRVAMPLLDLDELESLTDLAPLWRAEGRAPMTFFRGDYMGAAATSLRTTVVDLVDQRLGLRLSGPIRLLAHNRTWGWCFNPIALYYCYAPAGDALEAVVADVTNTPWGESHAYVIDTRGGLDHLATQAKELHVSPFLPLDLTYRFGLSVPGAACGFSVTVLQGPEAVLRTGFALRRRPLSRRNVASMLVRHPFMTHQVSASIYAHAAGLWLRRTPLVAHPGAAA